MVDNGDNDADDADGFLEVDGLAWGDYTLTETVAPTGYDLDATAHTFTVDAKHTVLDLGKITNFQTAVVPDPGARVNTGGTAATGQDVWGRLAASGAAMILSLAAVLLVRRRRQHASHELLG